MKIATDFHNKKLIDKTFHKGWKKLLELKTLNHYLSQKFRERALITTWFDHFKKGYAIERTEREIQEYQLVDNFK